MEINWSVFIPNAIGLALLLSFDWRLAVALCFLEIGYEIRIAQDKEKTR